MPIVSNRVVQADGMNEVSNIIPACWFAVFIESSTPNLPAIIRIIPSTNDVNEVVPSGHGMEIDAIGQNPRAIPLC